MGIWSFWLVLAVGFFVAEVFTLSTVCLYIGFGAVFAMVASWLGCEWIGSIITFVASTTILYLATYRWRKNLNNWLHKGASHTATGMDALIGRKSKIINIGDSNRIKIDGDTWQVESALHGAYLKVGDTVRVVGYDSIILKVEKIVD